MKKKTIGAIIAGVLLIGGCSIMGNDNSSIDKTMTELERQIEVKETIEAIENNNNNYTVGQENAIKKAEAYLKYTSFSKQGLKEQLEYEGFSIEDAEFAINNIIVDWNEQAAKKAKSYMEYSSFSRQGLLEQLEYEGFTAEQSEYGAAAVGY